MSESPHTFGTILGGQVNSSVTNLQPKRKRKRKKKSVASVEDQPSVESRSDADRVSSKGRPSKSVIAQVKARQREQKRMEKELQDNIREEERRIKAREEDLLQKQRELRIKRRERRLQNREKRKKKKEEAERTRAQERLKDLMRENTTTNSPVSPQSLDRKSLPNSMEKVHQPTDLCPHSCETTITTTGALRSPIIAVLGHANVGKTTILDYIRHSNVQGHEVNGITQQIGATYIPQSTLIDMTLESDSNRSQVSQADIKVPGLLIIDTPGHESFHHLRSRGSNLCDMAILVVDILHGVEAQTLESLRILRESQTPFVVALNKIDAIYGWKSSQNIPRLSVNKMFYVSAQTRDVQIEFKNLIQNIQTQFSEQGFNARLYTELSPRDRHRYVNLVPVSGRTGEGLANLVQLLCHLIQTCLSKRISQQETFEATILEVTQTEGLGTTLDVILSQGSLSRGDTIAVCGRFGPIFAKVRALLIPEPCKESTTKGNYTQYQTIHAAMSVKVVAKGLASGSVIAGTPLMLVGPQDDREIIGTRVQAGLNSLLSKLSEVGVSIHASTLGGLEALVHLLSQQKIPVRQIHVGPIRKSDVVKVGVYRQREEDSQKIWATILAYDVAVDKEARYLAEQQGIKILESNLIFHLCNAFVEWHVKCQAEAREAVKDRVVFPAVLSIIDEDHVFRKTPPYILGVKVQAGILKLGAPLCIPSRKNIVLGRVISMEDNGTPITEALNGQKVAVKIDGESALKYGRHFTYQDELWTLITRESLDLLKKHYRSELKADASLVDLLVRMKKQFHID
jgi:translation initiation factor aIF-2/yIF-2